MRYVATVRKIRWRRFGGRRAVGFGRTVVDSPPGFTCTPQHLPGTRQPLHADPGRRPVQLVQAGLLAERAEAGLTQAMSWRDDTPQPVQDDLDRVASEALSAAQHLLETNGEFYPFAVSLEGDGAAAMAGADPDQGEHPSSQAVLEMLYSGVAAQRDAIKAAAFVAPVATADGDAVRVEIEHRDGGPALELLLPYRLSATLELGELAAGAGSRHVWP